MNLSQFPSRRYCSSFQRRDPAQITVFLNELFKRTTASRRARYWSRRFNAPVKTADGKMLRTLKDAERRRCRPNLHDSARLEN
jgi:hypothetical protein